MTNPLDALIIIFTEFYFYVTVVIMWFIHVGFTMYEVGTSRRKNMLHTLSKNLMLIPVITFSFYFFGWWSYWSFAQVPFGPFIEAPWALPWSNLMGPNFGGVDDPDGWARINGAFGMAFCLFAWTTGSIVSGALIERVRLGAFLVMISIFGGWWWIVDAAWGWHPGGWMAHLLGYHDAYAAGIVHTAAGAFALGILIVLGPRIGKFGPNGEVRQIPLHNKWMVCVGLVIILTGFWGFMAACHVPFWEITGDPENQFFTATNIYGTPLTLSNLLVNYIMAISAGMMAMYFLSKGDPFWVMSGMISGVVSVAPGMDLYFPMQTAGIAFLGSIFCWYVHFWVEKRFKIDDAVGAVAVHGYAGVWGVVICGFVLWGYPNTAPFVLNEGWFANNADGWPTVNPLGNAVGEAIMFLLFGLIPGYIFARILQAFGLLRYPREIELAGQDSMALGDAYPYFATSETEFEAIERTYAREQ